MWPRTPSSGVARSAMTKADSAAEPLGDPASAREMIYAVARGASLRGVDEGVRPYIR
jgi:hypothetical protein